MAPTQKPALVAPAKAEAAYRAAKVQKAPARKDYAGWRAEMASWSDGALLDHRHVKQVFEANRRHGFGAWVDALQDEIASRAARRGCGAE